MTAEVIDGLTNMTECEDTARRQAEPVHPLLHRGPDVPKALP